jgi:hypothetical protein
MRAGSARRTLRLPKTSSVLVRRCTRLLLLPVESRGRMTSRAATTGLPQPDQYFRPTSLAPDEQPGQGHRDLGVAPPDCTAATTARRHEGAVQPDGQGVTRCAPTPTATPHHSQAPTARTPGYDLTLAPRPTAPTPRQGIPAQTPGSAPHRSIHPSPGPAPGEGKSELGLPTNPRRTSRLGREGCRLHRLADPHRRRHRPRTHTRIQHLGTVAPLPSRGHAGLRLLRNRHAHRHPHVRAGSDRARSAPDPHPRRDTTSDRGLGNPSHPQPRHGP